MPVQKPLKLDYRNPESTWAKESKIKIISLLELFIGYLNKQKICFQCHITKL